MDALLRNSIHNEFVPVCALLRNQCVVLSLHVRSVNALCVRDALAVVLCLLTSSPFALVVGDERKFLEDIILRPVVKSQRMGDQQTNTTHPICFAPQNLGDARWLFDVLP